jgi:hypothetical protein
MKDRTAIAFLAGFALCYATGALLCFNIMMTLRLLPDDAAYRSATWFYTLWTTNDWLAMRLTKSPRGIVIP